MSEKMTPSVEEILKTVAKEIEATYSTSFVEPVKTPTPKLEDTIEFIESMAKEPLKPYQKKLIRAIMTTEDVVNNCRVHVGTGRLNKHGRK